jgi:hypothetical protein
MTSPDCAGLALAAQTAAPPPTTPVAANAPVNSPSAVFRPNTRHPQPPAAAGRPPLKIIFVIA